MRGKKPISNDNHEAPSPWAINPDWKIFWQLELTSRPSLLVAMFRNNTQHNNKADSPSVLISKLCLSFSLHCNHPDSSTLLWGSNQTCSFSPWLLRSLQCAEINVCGSNEALRHSLHDIKCFSVIDPFILAQSAFLSLSLSLSVSSSFTFLLSSLFFPCSYPLDSSYFKIPSLHWFSSSPLFLWGLFSLLLLRVHFVQQLPHRAVLQFELRLWGNALVRWREKGGWGQGRGITARLPIRSRVFPSFSCLASNWSRIWSLHI